MKKQKNRFKEILEGIFIIIAIDIYLAYLFVLPIIANDFFIKSKILFVLIFLIWFSLIVVGWNYEFKVIE